MFFVAVKKNRADLQSATTYEWAGPTFIKAKYGYRGKGATGMGVRLLYQFIKNRA